MLKDSIKLRFVSYDQLASMNLYYDHIRILKYLNTF